MSHGPPRACGNKCSARPVLNLHAARKQTDGIDRNREKASGLAGSTPARARNRQQQRVARRQAGGCGNGGAHCSVLGFSVMRPGSEAEA
jgi:hypothetical protein